MKKLFITILLFSFYLPLAQAQNYIEDTVHIQTDGHRLGGVIMTPDTDKKRYPVVLIIQGSGPTDKDGNSITLTGKNNSLKLLAEELASNGIASLRFDKRGMGLSADETVSEDNLVFDDFVNDAQAWLEYLLDDKRFRKIAVAGHSQGSLIGMRLAQNNNVKALVSISGPSLTIDETILAQIKANPFNPDKLIREAEAIFEELDKGKTVDSIPPYLVSIFRPSIQPFMISWMQYDPLIEIEKLDMPILVISGSTDLQVSVEDTQRLQIANPKAILKIIDGMNHVLKNTSANTNENVASYSNPDLPLNEEFKDSILRFFEKYLK